MELDIKYEPNRVYIEDDNHNLLGEVTFPSLDANTVDINHTYVHPSLRGQGIGSKLLDAAMKYIKRTGRTAKFTCPMVIKKYKS